MEEDPRELGTMQQMYKLCMELPAVMGIRPVVQVPL